MTNKNKFSKALKHLRTKTEVVGLSETAPTNNTSGVFVDTPYNFTPETTVPGDVSAALNLSQDGDGAEGYDGKDTTGLFEADGTIKAVEPPGDTSYVLGPMMSMWYAWANYTQIGYVRQSDRKMVNLGRITGELDDWDGSSGFTSYGQLTLEQAVWFKNESRSDYRAFYPGPPSNPADDLGRYLGSMIDTSKSVFNFVKSIFNPGENTGFDPSDVFSSLLNLLLGTDDSILGDLIDSIGNSPLGKQGTVFLGYLTNQLGDVIDNKFLGQDYVNDSFANMTLDPFGKFSSVGDNIIGSGQYPTYDPATNEIKLQFNYDFKKNAEEFKKPELANFMSGPLGAVRRGVYDALGQYSVDAQVAAGTGNPLGPLSGAVFSTLIQSAKTLGGGKPTPGEITISPQQLQQINPQAYNQLVNRGDVPSDAASKPSQNKQAPKEGAKIDPEKAIESLKQKLPADKRAQVDFQQTMSMDNFSKLSKADQNKVMTAMKDRYVSRRDGSNFIGADKYMRATFKAQVKQAQKTKFKDGYMIDKDPFTGKSRKTPIFSTIPGRSSVLVMGNNPSGMVLTENKKKILKNLKKPVETKEMPTKFKVKPTARTNKTVGADMMKVPESPSQYQPPAPNIWSMADKKKNERASQERKNEVLELVGAAEHHWTYLTEDRRRQRQEKVNEMMSAEFDKQMELLYEKHQVKEAKVSKAISAFKKPTDIKPEFPKEPPPKMDPKTGMHPKYGKNYKHDKLDPHSAEFMPPTGNPEIDANVQKAQDSNKKARKLKILMGKMKKS